MKTRLKTDCFLFSKGDTFSYDKDSLMTECCDSCGKKKPCFWFEYSGSDETKRFVGFDCCKLCKRQIMEQIE